MGDTTAEGATMTTNGATPRRRTPRKMTYSQSVEKYLRESQWITDAEAPAVTTLRSLADALDNGPLVPALVAQFGMTFRSLQKREPSAAGEKDELDGLLDDAPGD